MYHNHNLSNILFYSILSKLTKFPFPLVKRKEKKKILKNQKNVKQFKFIFVLKMKSSARKSA